MVISQLQIFAFNFGSKSPSSILKYTLTFRLHGIQLLDHPGISPDMNPTEKVWRQMRRCLLARIYQPSNTREMEQAMQEEWEAVPQEYINAEILKQKDWVRMLIKARG